LYNTAIPVIPAAVTRPTTPEDISKIIKCAVASAVKVQPRSGGHSYANYCLGGEDNAVVVDMVNFQQFKMDNSTMQATIGAGTLLGDVTKRLHNAGGRAIAHGTCPQVGIGGHATIGGLGPTSRMWGATLDHVVEVGVVLADGTITRASKTQNPDVFFVCLLCGLSLLLYELTTIRIGCQRSCSLLRHCHRVRGYNAPGTQVLSTLYIPDPVSPHVSLSSMPHALLLDSGKKLISPPRSPHGKRLLPTPNSIASLRRK
jgi:hypothetical protein